MRTLVILRGVSGSGKSQFIKEQGLEDYTISSDKLRLEYSAPELNTNGEMIISGKHDAKIWGYLFELLNFRMSQGEFTVVDATNLDIKTLKRYEQLKRRYGYKVVLVDFVKTLDEVLKANEKRKGLVSYVPVSAIKRQHNKYLTSEVPKGFVDEYYNRDAIKDSYNDFKTKLDKSLWHDLNDYKKIHHIGDVHGCRDALSTYLIGGKLNSDEFYIFVGDYTDRGIQNAETVSYLTSIRDEPNVIFLEGNHDKRLVRFSKGRKSASDEASQFQKTKEELNLALKEGKLDLYEIREWTSTFKEAFFYRYQDTIVIVSHGGISYIPTSDSNTFLTGLSSEHYIDGTGTRDFDVDYEFSQRAELHNEQLEPNLRFSRFIQVHGHRNKFKLAIDQYPNSYNLEGRVEFGEYLRVLTIKKGADKAVVESHYIENRTFESEVPREIKEKIEPVNIVGFNGFDNIVRGYGKLKEISFDKGVHLTRLANTLVFPVVGYQAYDGDTIYMYMAQDGLTIKVYGDNNRDEVESRFLELANFTAEQLETIIDFVKEHNVTLAFALVDNDFSNIVKHNESKVVLLDAIKNEEGSLTKLADMEVQELTNSLENVEYKQISFIAKTWNSFLKLYRAIKSDEENLFGKGFIIEDVNDRNYLIKNNTYRLTELLKEYGKSYELDQNDFTDISKSALGYYREKLESLKDA